MAKKKQDEPKTGRKTLVFERAEALLKRNAKGCQTGHLDQAKKLAKELGQPTADAWLKEHVAQTMWARSILAMPLSEVLLWDTETTGTNQAAEVIDLGVVRLDRSIVIDTLIKPDSAISAGASAVHGITAATVADAPKWIDVWPSVLEALHGVKLIIAYNDGFDRRLIQQACYLADLEVPVLPPSTSPELMIRFANWCGDWDAKYTHFKWHKLESGHRAVGDSLAMIDALEKMASSEATC